jgi:sugar phosphate isomerase/epimerase
MRLIASLAFAVALSFSALTLFGARSEPSLERQFDGFNVIAAPDHPFGSESAKTALTNAKALGARTVAIIPFLWQSSPSNPNLVRGTDMDDAELRYAIRDAHALGFVVLVKPHLWVPDSWAGMVAGMTEQAWSTWFANYQRELDRIARIAEDERAEALAIGTELDGTTQRTEWNVLIDTVHNLYSGRLLYVAHNAEGAERVPFWDRLDFIGVSLYPPLGADDDRDGRLRAMRDC